MKSTTFLFFVLVDDANVTNTRMNLYPNLSISIAGYFKDLEVNDRNKLTFKCPFEKSSFNLNEI